MKLAEDLRRSVLQAAIEGKLTGGSREGWRFVRLCDILSYGESVAKVSAKNIPANSWLLDLEDIEKGGRILRHRTAQETKSTGDKAIFHQGDILYSKLRPYLQKVLIASSDGYCTPELILFYCYGETEPQYIVYFLKAPSIDYKINSESYGVKMPRVGTNTMKKLLVPLPPIDEQRRIVSRLNAILPLIAELESAENELEALERKFSGDMRESLLKAAIEGRLTGGNTDNWRYVRLGECALVGSGKTPAKDFLSSEGTIPFYRVADMNLRGNEKIMNEANTFLTEKYKGKLTPFPSVIFPKNGGAVFTNKRRFLNKPSLIDLNTGFIFPTDINIEYLFYWFSSIDLSLYAIGTALPTVNASIISNLIIPLPPIEEQYKIVARLKELLPLCEAMKGE